MTQPSPFAQHLLLALRSTYAPRSLSKADLLAEQYLLAREGPYRVYYAALGASPAPAATLILVGLTPGLSQTIAAARLFEATPPAIRNDDAAYRARLREHVAFHGSMRANLCRMLDVLGLPQLVNVPRSEALFQRVGDYVGTTSALVYPVFTGPELRNFSGGSQDLGRTALFRRMLDELLAPRLLAAPSALIVPFGKAAASGVRYLTEAGVVSDDRVLSGFPHPSGANGHRKRQFEERREHLASTLASWFEKTAHRG